MALVAAPGNGIAFRINHGDGSIVPCDPSNGPASLGMMTILKMAMARCRCARRPQKRIFIQSTLVREHPRAGPQ